MTASAETEPVITPPVITPRGVELPSGAVIPVNAR